MAPVQMSVVRHICFMEKHYWNWQGNITHNFPMKYKTLTGSYLNSSKQRFR